MEDYAEREISEIRNLVKAFKRRNFLRLPSLIRGSRVASRNSCSKVRNYSTVTGCFLLSTGKWIYIVYAYPLSIIHRLIDGFGKWATEKYCIKAISLKKWQGAFIENSLIPIIITDIPGVVVMPYIENENLFDVMAGRVGNYTFQEKEAMIAGGTRIINDMHSADIVWGELIVNNMIRSDEGKIVLCDTETRYYRGTLVEQKASDWLDFICSACGSVFRVHPEKIDVFLQTILEQIKDSSVVECLKERCRKKRTLLHTLFFPYTRVRLACSPKLYCWIKAEVSTRLC